MGIAGTPIHWLALTLAIVGVVVVVPATATSVALLLGLGLTAIGLVMWAAPSRPEGPPPGTDGAPQAAVISKPTDTTIDAPGYPPGVFLEFAEGLPTETLERAIIFFGLLNDEEEIDAGRLSLALRCEASELPRLLLAPLRARAKALDMSLPYGVDLNHRREPAHTRHALVGQMYAALHEVHTLRGREAARGGHERPRVTPQEAPNF